MSLGDDVAAGWSTSVLEIDGKPSKMCTRKGSGGFSTEQRNTTNDSGGAFKLEAGNEQALVRRRVGDLRYRYRCQ